MMDSEVLRTRTANTLTSLLSELEYLSQHELHTVSNDCVYVFGKSGLPLRLRLIKDTLTDRMSDSTIRIPHKIGSEVTLAATCAALLKEGILFEAVDHGDAYVITLKGY